MAKPNYSFAKRQRDLAKEQKKEEKLQRKKTTAEEEGAGQNDADATDSTEETAPAGETPSV